MNFVRNNSLSVFLHSNDTKSLDIPSLKINFEIFPREFLPLIMIQNILISMITCICQNEKKIHEMYKSSPGNVDIFFFQ